MTRRSIRPVALAATALAAVLALAGCAADTGADDGPETGAPAETTTAPALEGTVTVYAAASLTNVFQQLGDRFEAEHPSVDVVFSFGGSSGLVTQLTEGAQADVFASADQPNLQKLVDAGLVADGSAQLFATNTLEIATPPDNPAGIAGFADLGKPGVRLVVCAAQVPCGAATVRAAEAAGVTLSPVSEEQAVTDVLAKVSSGDADAGLVYSTDVAGAGGAVHGIPFPEASAAVNDYPIARLTGSANPELADAWIAFVLGDEGQQALADAGFGAP